MSVDFNKAAMLLHIVDTARPDKFPGLSRLYGEAMRELQEINDLAAEEADERIAAQKEEAARLANEDKAEKLERAARAKVVTPPEGPANSAFQETPDGPIERYPQRPLDDVRSNPVASRPEDQAGYRKPEPYRPGQPTPPPNPPIPTEDRRI